jgi:phosphoglycolate phosphatase
MNLRRPALIVFDLDGTLVDSAPDIAYCVDTLLESLGRPAAGLEKVRSWIGNGVGMLVKRALTGELWPQGDPEGFDAALERFMGLYGENMCVRTTLFPGVLEGIKALHGEGYRLACVTNKHSDFTRPLLEILGLAPWLDFIGSGDQFAHHKPHPEPLLKTAEHFGLNPGDCLMVGDSENDVEAARAAGFAVICVPYGYRRCGHPEDLRADALVDSVSALPELFKQAA